MNYNSGSKTQASLLHLMLLCSSLYFICFIYMLIHSVSARCQELLWELVIHQWGKKKQQQEKSPDLTKMILYQEGRGSYITHSTVSIAMVWVI